MFSQNLEWFKERPGIKLIPDIKDGYICPICINTFQESDLQSDSENQLTIEHVPPDSLGGKPIILTCKKCNSKSGHSLDKNLYDLLLLWDFNSFLPNSKTNTKFELNGNKVNGIINIDEKGTWKINIRTKYSNPNETKPFMEGMFPPRTIFNPVLHPDKMLGSEIKTSKFSFGVKNNINIKHAEVATLRIAYLYAYTVFGNSLLVNTSLGKVRKQILNPDEDILPRPFWINYNFTDEWDGINFIREPKDLKCLLIVFTLKTKSKSRKFAIALPGPTSPDVNIYENIRKAIGKDKGFENITIDHIANEDFLKNKSDTFAFIEYWKGLGD